MAQAFIIMQIGKKDLDVVCAKAIVPALESCGLDPKRVDKHNEGDLLKSEIIAFIEKADIIIAELTNERPNCYLEVGYAMGIDKFRNLILTAREDHNQDSPNYKHGGSKIHFDLSGYDILYWDPSELDEFREELTKRIRRRLTIIQPAEQQQSPWDSEWIQHQRERADQGLHATGKRGFMEIRFALDPPKPHKTQQELDHAARAAPMQSTGWPIAVYLPNREEYRPRPTADGIIAEIAPEERSGYDYWAIRRNGDFYLLSSILEDARDPTQLYYNLRIIRVTETLLYCARLYGQLGIDRASVVNIAIRHGGLKGRCLGTTDRLGEMGMPKKTIEDESETTIRLALADIEKDLVAQVKAIAAPLFTLFDFQEFKDVVYEDIVNKFVEGRSQW